MNGMTRVWILLALALPVAAGAQRIEISSDSIGTVVVTPPAVGTGNADASSRMANDTRERNPRRTGVDLGIQRRPDGTLYDPLDPNQNPAAATPGTTEAEASSNVGAGAAARSR